MDQYAVIGSPISHSLSPEIHQRFAAQTEQQLSYTALAVEPENFYAEIQALTEQGLKGLNVTLPLKTLAWEMADHCDPAANQAQAVNTVVFADDGQRHGYNTDGIGLLRDLQNNHHITLENKRLLVLGAGGAVRGVLLPLLETKPELLMLVNRTVAKAQALAKQFSVFGPVQAATYTELAQPDLAAFDVIINGTAASLENTVPPLPANCLISGGVCYDMLYRQHEPTAFVRWGLEHHASQALDGIGMLVEQAAEAFRIWRGVMPNTAAVIQHLRAIDES